MAMIDRRPDFERNVMHHNMFVAFTLEEGKITILPPERLELTDSFMGSVDISLLGIDNFLMEGMTLEDVGSPVYGNFYVGTQKGDEEPKEVTGFFVNNTDFNLVNYLVLKPEKDFYIAVLNVEVGIKIVDDTRLNDKGEPILGIDIDYENLRMQVSLQNMMELDGKLFSPKRTFEYPQDMSTMDVSRVPDNFKDLAELGLKFYFAPENGTLTTDLINMYHTYVSGRLAIDELYTKYGQDPLRVK